MTEPLEQLITKNVNADDFLIEMAIAFHEIAKCIDVAYNKIQSAINGLESINESDTKYLVRQYQAGD